MCDISKQIRREIPPGTETEPVELTIEYLTGFELFNTRPYHNYETFSTGWRVSGRGIKVEFEDLETAVTQYLLKRAAQGRKGE